MINHSTLLKFLSGAEVNGKSIPFTLMADIAELTSAGVIREGGPLAPCVKPSTPACDFMTFDKPTQDVLNKLGINGNHTETDSSSLASVSQNMASAKPKFVLGSGSMKELQGVNGDLVRCVQRAIQLTTIDFVVYDGIRSLKEQSNHVAHGTSKTMQSKHLDGLAVDLVPYIGGKPVWDWNGCYRIAFAMDQAATELNLAHRITWGGAWDRKLSDFGGDLGSYEQEVQLYKTRHAGSDFIDGPHFEITR